MWSLESRNASLSRGLALDSMMSFTARFKGCLRASDGGIPSDLLAPGEALDLDVAEISCTSQLQTAAATPLLSLASMILLWLSACSTNAMSSKLP